MQVYLCGQETVVIRKSKRKSSMVLVEYANGERLWKDKKTDLIKLVLPKVRKADSDRPA